MRPPAADRAAHANFRVRPQRAAGLAGSPNTLQLLTMRAAWRVQAARQHSNGWQQYHLLRLTGSGGQHPAARTGSVRVRVCAGRRERLHLRGKIGRTTRARCSPQQRCVGAVHGDLRAMLRGCALLFGPLRGARRRAAQQSRQLRGEKAGAKHEPTIRWPALCIELRITARCALPHRPATRTRVCPPAAGAQPRA
jgi:hypothetical protein